MDLDCTESFETYEWKSATVAFSPAGNGMNSELAPLMTVRGTRFPDTVLWSELVLGDAEVGHVRQHKTELTDDNGLVGNLREIQAIE